MACVCLCGSYSALTELANRAVRGKEKCFLEEEAGFRPGLRAEQTDISFLSNKNFSYVKLESTHTHKFLVTS